MLSVGNFKLHFSKGVFWETRRDTEIQSEDCEQIIPCSVLGNLRSTFLKNHPGYLEKIYKFDLIVLNV